MYISTSLMVVERLAVSLTPLKKIMLRGITQIIYVTGPGCEYYLIMSKSGIKLTKIARRRI